MTNIRALPLRAEREALADVANWTREPRRIDGRTPPHDLDAEAAVLTACILTPPTLDRVAGLLEPASFYSEAHRLIFEACHALHRSGAPVDMVQVGTWLKSRDRLHQVGGFGYLTDMMNSVAAITNPISYAKTIRDHWRMRQFITASQHLAAEAYFDCGDPQAFLDQAASAIQRVAQLGGEDAIERNIDTVKRIVEQMRRASERGSIVTGLPTGFDRLDRMTSGIHPCQLVVVGGRPAMGKTSFGANIAEHVATQGVGVLFFSLEMSRDEIVRRAIAGRARIDSMRIATGNLLNAEWSRFNDAAKQYAQLPIWIDDRAGVTVDQIAARSRQTMHTAASTKTGLGLIVVDYLQKIAPANESRRLPRHEQVAQLSSALKNLAKQTQIPVLALAQLNRDSAKGAKTDRRPSMVDLRESGAIEADADVILLLHREGYYVRDAEDKSAEILIEKQRNGPTGIVNVAFERQFTRFENAREDCGGHGYV